MTIPFPSIEYFSLSMENDARLIPKDRFFGRGGVSELSVKIHLLK